MANRWRMAKHCHAVLKSFMEAFRSSNSSQHTRPLTAGPPTTQSQHEADNIGRPQLQRRRASNLEVLEAHNKRPRLDPSHPYDNGASEHVDHPARSSVEVQAQMGAAQIQGMPAVPSHASLVENFPNGHPGPMDFVQNQDPAQTMFPNREQNVPEVSRGNRRQPPTAANSYNEPRTSSSQPVRLFPYQETQYPANTINLDRMSVLDDPMPSASNFGILDVFSGATWESLLNVMNDQEQW